MVTRRIPDPKIGGSIPSEVSFLRNMKKLPLSLREGDVAQMVARDLHNFLQNKSVVFVTLVVLTSEGPDGSNMFSTSTNKKALV